MMKLKKMLLEQINNNEISGTKPCVSLFNKISVPDINQWRCGMKRKLALIMAIVLLVNVNGGMAIASENSSDGLTEAAEEVVDVVVSEEAEETAFSEEVMSELLEETTAETVETEFVENEITETVQDIVEAEYEETEEEKAEEIYENVEAEAPVESEASVTAETETAESNSSEFLTTEDGITVAAESGISTVSAGDSISTATSISIGTTYSGAISSSNTKDYYKFTLSSSGTVELVSTIYMQYINYRIFDVNGSQVWSNAYSWNSSTQQVAIDTKVCLTSGTYYLEAEQRYGSTGNYNFTLSFVSSEESFIETDGGMNNSLSAVSSISMDRTCNEQIAANDTTDFYTFALSESGTVSLTSTAYMQYICYRIFDASGNQLWSDAYSWNSSTGMINISETICLTSGTYYFKIEQRYGSTGDYTFSTVFTSSKESFAESNGGVNNSLSASSNASVNATYNGQIALNDTSDFYIFTLSTSGTISLTSTAYMQYVCYRIFDANGNQLWSDAYSWNSNTKMININETICLTSGTYYFKIEQRYGSTGDYTFATVFTSSAESFTEDDGGNNNTIATANAINIDTSYNGQIAINDSKDFYKITLSQYHELKLTSTAGMQYVYYRLFDANGNQLWYSSSSWNSSSKKINLSNTFYLSAGTYYFEVEQKYGSCGDYSFKFASAINLASPTISGIKNTSSGIQITWTKVSDATGYYIYRRTASGSYSKIKTITNNSTVSYTDTAVKSKNGTTYYYCTKSLTRRLALSL
ncbi:MAG: hypothetical protein LUI39_06605 [Lachnospiraceae bacterium]|nr:hypothetical protein [Lachnospiraceae bacterium]